MVELRLCQLSATFLFPRLEWDSGWRLDKPEFGERVPCGLTTRRAIRGVTTESGNDFMN